jgi:hypothetical protein
MMCRVRVHMGTKFNDREVHLEQRPGKRQELLLDTDKPLIALYIALGCLDC